MGSALAKTTFDRIHELVGMFRDNFSPWSRQRKGHSGRADVFAKVGLGKRSSTMAADGVRPSVGSGRPSNRTRSCSAFSWPSRYPRTDQGTSQGGARRVLQRSSGQQPASMPGRTGPAATSGGTPGYGVLREWAVLATVGRRSAGRRVFTRTPLGSFVVPSGSRRTAEFGRTAPENGTVLVVDNEVLLDRSVSLEADPTSKILEASRQSHRSPCSDRERQSTRWRSNAGQVSRSRPA